MKDLDFHLTLFREHREHTFATGRVGQFSTIGVGQFWKSANITLDTCDREAITWTATTAGISGEMIRDMMLVAVERRFGGCSTTHRVEYLTDNGSCYTAHETIEFALSLGLMPVFTPVRSPESNGMAESFVKTFKRDYVRCNPRPDATTVLAQLDSWFEDYNTSHPHRALKMLSPREFIQANLALAACPA